MAINTTYKKVANFHLMRRIFLVISLALTVFMISWQIALLSSRPTSIEWPFGAINMERQSTNATAAASSTSSLLTTKSISSQKTTDSTSKRTQLSDLKSKLTGVLIKNSKSAAHVESNIQKGTNGATGGKSTPRPDMVLHSSAVPQLSPHDDVCRLYGHLDLPASNASGPQYTYRYRPVGVIRAPQKQHLCNNETRVFAAINSAVFNFDNRKAVCKRFQVTVCTKG